jgi:uncharacterized damage-inducible protein DinB
MEKQALRDLFDIHYRENRRVWSRVTTLSDEQFTRELDSVTGSIRAQLVHMVAEENLWVNYLWHDGIEFLQEADFPSRPAIRYEWDELEEEILDFVDDLTPTELEREVAPDFLNGTSVKIREVLLQLIDQASERRAQILAGLQRIDAPHPRQKASGYCLGGQMTQTL